MCEGEAGTGGIGWEGGESWTLRQSGRLTTCGLGGRAQNWPELGGWSADPRARHAAARPGLPPLPCSSRIVTWFLGVVCESGHCHRGLPGPGCGYPRSDGVDRARSQVRGVTDSVVETGSLGGFAAIGGQPLHVVDSCAAPTARACPAPSVVLVSELLTVFRGLRVLGNLGKLHEAPLYLVHVIPMLSNRWTSLR